VTEGSRAVGIAALRARAVRRPGITAVVVSGGNIDMALHDRYGAACAPDPGRADRARRLIGHP
jgi:threonine dehydratase